MEYKPGTNRPKSGLRDGDRMGFVMGCRIPHEYFVTSGSGQTNEGPGNDHFETGSYDLALLDASIENFNVMKYTSVMPKEAVQIGLNEAKPRFHHGAVLECIMAMQNGENGDTITAGVGVCKVEVDGVIIGGFAAEYEGDAPEEQAKTILEGDLARIVDRRYRGHKVNVFDEQYVIKSCKVGLKYGTVLAAVCFLSHIYPEA